MSDGKYQPLTDNSDDLPRTFRRERENRERAAREQQAREQNSRNDGWNGGGQLPATQSIYGAPDPANPYDQPETGRGRATEVTVRRFKVPFFSLAGYYIKSVFAAVPALLILMAMLYGLGVLLQAYFPQLIKLKITIAFPG